MKPGFTRGGRIALPAYVLLRVDVSERSLHHGAGTAGGVALFSCAADMSLDMQLFRREDRG